MISIAWPVLTTGPGERKILTGNPKRAKKSYE
jgi:hypothetical protein